MNDKEKYIGFCSEERLIPIFSQPWWLDAVCGNKNWDVILYIKDNRILASLPYYIKKSHKVFEIITQPPFSQNNGCIILYDKGISYEKRMSYEKEVMTYLIHRLEQLPIAGYTQYFNVDYTNWLPFYWLHYNQTVYYTYIYDKLFQIKDDELLKSYTSDKRKNILNGVKKGLTCVDAISSKFTVWDFYQFHRQCLLKQGREISYSYELLKRMIEAVESHNSGKVLLIKDSSENVCAVTFFVWDYQMAYGINTAICHGHKEAGALVFHEAIKFASQVVDKFNMGGSMIESVENSYRRFGTKQFPYFRISKSLSRNYTVLMKIRDIIDAIKN